MVGAGDARVARRASARKDFPSFHGLKTHRKMTIQSRMGPREWNFRREKNHPIGAIGVS